MVDIVIFEGLKEAVSKGESLKQAMMSFYNAGYEKKHIEQAARALQMQQRGQPLPITQYAHPKKNRIQKKNIQPKQKPIQRISTYAPPINNNKESIKKIKQGINSAINQLNRIEFPNGHNKMSVSTPQKISNYGAKPKRKKAIIFLVIFLVVLLGILGAVFLFKEQILSFFDNSSFFKGLF